MKPIYLVTIIYLLYYLFFTNLFVFRNDSKLYSLHMTEDDGEVDEDFPALDKKVRTIPKMALCKLSFYCEHLQKSILHQR